MADDPADQGDLSFLIRGLLPCPIPFRYRFLDAEERAGRGRMAIRLWVLGFSPETAWGFAMTEDAGWREHSPDRYQGRLDDAVLEGEVIRRRLWEVVKASDLYREVLEELRREAAGRESAMTSGGSAVSAPTRCVANAPGTTTPLGVTSDGPRKARDRMETCTPSARGPSESGDRSHPGRMAS